MRSSRRSLACLLLWAACVRAVGAMRAGERVPPVVFVHGNGNTAGLWITTMWRFECNGYPRELLHAVDLRYPTARSVDAAGGATTIM